MPYTVFSEGDGMEVDLRETSTDEDCEMTDAQPQQPQPQPRQPAAKAKATQPKREQSKPEELFLFENMTGMQARRKFLATDWALAIAGYSSRSTFGMCIFKDDVPPLEVLKNGRVVAYPSANKAFGVVVVEAGKRIHTRRKDGGEYLGPCRPQDKRTLEAVKERLELGLVIWDPERGPLMPHELPIPPFQDTRLYKPPTEAPPYTTTMWPAPRDDGTPPASVEAYGREGSRGAADYVQFWVDEYCRRIEAMQEQRAKGTGSGVVVRMG